jgi:predicted ferric reductase
MNSSWRGWTIVLLLSFLPVVIWMTQSDAMLRFGDTTSVFLSLGQLSSLIGMAMFSISLILSLRIAWLEEFFDGMNVVYQAHHSLGGISFILLLLHPLFLLMPYSGGAWDAAASFLLPGSDWSINIGIAALLSMMTLLYITYYLDLQYQLWRYTHKFLGAAFFLGVLHSFFVSSDILRYPPLWWYMLIICFFGWMAFTYRTLLGLLLVPKYRYRIDRVIHDSGRVVELVLRPYNPNRRLRYIPGQFVFMSMSGKGIVDTDPHPFSISSPPQSDTVRLSIKALGDYSTWIANIAEGSDVQLEGPYGRFSYVFNPNSSYIWIGGGIGITPFVSMAYTLTGGTSVDIYYCAGDPTESAHLSELQTLSQVTPNLRIIPWYSKQQGRLTGQKVVETSNALQGKDIFICGPAPMMHALKSQLKQCGVPSGRIHTEEFGMV